MPYVAPGSAPSSTIPNPSKASATNDSSSSSSTDPTPSQSNSSPSPPPPTSSPKMISTPSALTDSLSSLAIDAPPQSPSPIEDADGDSDTTPPRRGSAHSTKTTSSLPALDPHSASSSSIDSLAESSAASSPTTALTSPTTPAEDGREGGIARYREGLYAYTRELYLEAKLAETKEKRRSSGASNGFAPKQSGMEKLAAKEALAKRLNAGTYERD